jgi:hypothetical protein
MCPLRVILIFLSATIAGFFLIRGINAEPDQFQEDDGDDSGSPRAPVPLHSKVPPFPPPPTAAPILSLASCLCKRPLLAN